MQQCQLFNRHNFDCLKVGPIECIEFAYDEHELSENFAWVVFKYPSSVEDSIKLLQGTKLYGLEIITKKYSEHLKDPVFDDQLNYFKQLVNVERSNQSNNGNTSRWNNQNLDNQNIIPDSLPKPPTHGKYNLNNNYDHRSETMPRNNNKDESSKYQHNNSYIKSRDLDCRNEYRPVHYQKSEHNSRSDSMASNTDRNSYHNQNYDSNYLQDYGSFPSSKWKESNYYNQEQLHSNESLATKDVLPVRDLRDTIHRKRNIILDSDRHRDTNANATCTSVLDLRDTMYRGKNNTFKDVERSYQPEPKKRWSERKINSFDGGFSGKSYRKDNDRYNESNTKQTNRYSNQDYNDQSFNHNKSYDNYHKNENPNCFHSYNRERNTPINYKFNQPRHENLESRDHQQNSYYPYKRSDESHERKEYQNTYYNEQSGHGRGRSSNRGGSDKSRHNYYS